MKVLAILYSGGAAAKEEPRLLGTLENELGLRRYLESQGHEFLVSYFHPSRLDFHNF